MSCYSAFSRYYSFAGMKVKTVHNSGTFFWSICDSVFLLSLLRRSLATSIGKSVERHGSKPHLKITETGRIFMSSSLFRALRHENGAQRDSTGEQKVVGGLGQVPLRNANRPKPPCTRPKPSKTLHD